MTASHSISPRLGWHGDSGVCGRDRLRRVRFWRRPVHRRRRRVLRHDRQCGFGRSGRFRGEGFRRFDRRIRFRHGGSGLGGQGRQPFRRQFRRHLGSGRINGPLGGRGHNRAGIELFKRDAESRTFRFDRRGKVELRQPRHRRKDHRPMRKGRCATGGQPPRRRSATIGQKAHGTFRRCTVTRRTSSRSRPGWPSKSSTRVAGASRPITR